MEDENERGLVQRWGITGFITTNLGKVSNINI